MRASSRRKIVRAHKVFFYLLTIVGFSVVFTTVMIFSTTLKLGTIAPYFLPILASFFGFSAILYNRARAYPNGPTQRRSLFIANMALTATVLYLVGLLIGAAVTFFILSENTMPTAYEFSFSDPRIFNALLIYSPSLIFVGASFHLFAIALRLFCITLVMPSRLQQQLRKMKK
jgi:hypothetical protein